jgi:hypothetical protein
MLSLSWLQAAQAQKIAVNEADPNNAQQGESVNVLIKGRGFDSSAAVRFLLPGSDNDSGLVTVNSVTVHGPRFS